MTTREPNIDILAWTKNDGVTPPPKGVKPGVLGGSAAGMTGVWVALLSVDTLCPEHRAWVEVLATAALFASAAAIVGLFRHRSWSAPFALLSAGFGVAIGLIDLVHDPLRGALITIGFTAVAAVLLAVVVRQMQVTAWSRKAAAELRHLPDVDTNTYQTTDPAGTDHKKSSDETSTTSV